MSPPSPCSPSNLLLKTSFLPFIIFFPLPTSAAASRGLAMAGPESHVISAVAVAWEKKREVCVRTCFLAQLGGQRSTPISSSHERAAHFCPFPLFAVSIFPFFFAFSPPVWSKYLDSKPEADPDCICADVVVKSKHHPNIRRFTTTRPRAGHWLFEEFCPFALVKHVKKSITQVSRLVNVKFTKDETDEF